MTEIEDLNMTEVHKNIEQDVVEQILSTLPPKSLMRFKCVSKRWRALITDQRSNDYKVVNIGFPGVENSPDGYDINLPLKTAVYTLSSDSWRGMKTFSLETESTILFPDRFQLYSKGMCYWSGHELHKEVHAIDVQGIH
ncbi:hypothetical protein ACLB2K_018001 [Fragaria x ananassa]